MRFAESPDSDATAAAVFWDPRDCPHVLPVAAHPVASPSDAAVFDLSRISCRANVLLTPDGRQQVLVRDAGRCLQLAVSGASVFRPVALRVPAVVQSDTVRAHLGALACLNDLCASGRLSPRHFPPDPRGGRLRVVLRALDGSLAGASQRDIAVALFGQDRVKADWTDPGGHLRDHVRRAIRRARALMTGGYRQFLR